MIRTFDVKGTREGSAITGPTATIGGEVVGLRGTSRLIWKSEVVAATDEASFGGTGVLGGEGWALVA